MAITSMQRMYRTLNQGGEENAYTILGVDYSVTLAEAEKVYRHLATKWHPDKFRFHSKSSIEFANMMWDKLTAAFATVKQALCDRELAARKLHELPAN